MPVSVDDEDDDDNDYYYDCVTFVVGGDRASPPHHHHHMCVFCVCVRVRRTCTAVRMFRVCIRGCG